MIPYLFHIYGPIYANSYGLAILIGILTFLYLANRDKILKKILNYSQLSDIVLFATLMGVVGGAALYWANNWQTLTHWTDIFKIWEGGFSILGTIILVAITVPIYLKLKNIPILTFLDRISIYAPLVQSIARIGCFCAGCCYGRPTDSWFGITYTHPDSSAPLFCKIHPTQLYSSGILFLIFILMYFILQKKFKKPGQLLSLYLILSPLERFSVDFLRNDQEYFGNFKILSSNQIVALGISLIGFILFTYYSFKKYKKIL